jgi:hypothetical protein
VAHAHEISSFRRASHSGSGGLALSGVLLPGQLECDLRGGVALAGAFLRGYVYGQAGGHSLRGVAYVGEDGV